MNTVKSLSEIRATQPNNFFSQDAYLYLSENASNRAIKVSELFSYFNMLNHKTKEVTLEPSVNQIEIDTAVYKRCVLSGTSENITIKFLNFADADTFELVFNPSNVNVNLSNWNGEEIKGDTLCVLTIDNVVGNIFYTIKYSK